MSDLNPDPGTWFGPQTWGESGLSQENRRNYRERAACIASYMHSGDDNLSIVFERDESVRQLLATAEDLYQWIIQPVGHEPDQTKEADQ